MPPALIAVRTFRPVRLWFDVRLPALIAVRTFRPVRLWLAQRPPALRLVLIARPVFVFVEVMLIRSPWLGVELGCPLVLQRSCHGRAPANSGACAFCRMPSTNRAR